MKTYWLISRAEIQHKWPNKLKTTTLQIQKWYKVLQSCLWCEKKSGIRRWLDIKRYVSFVTFGQFYSKATASNLITFHPASKTSTVSSGLSWVEHQPAPLRAPPAGRELFRCLETQWFSLVSRVCVLLDFASFLYFLIYFKKFLFLNWIESCEAAARFFLQHICPYWPPTYLCQRYVSFLSLVFSRLYKATVRKTEDEGLDKEENFYRDSIIKMFSSAQWRGLFLTWF